MLTIEKVDTNNKPQVKRFVQFYYDLYKDCPEWVPPLYGDAYLPLNRKKHPFFEHSEADFFLAVDDGKVVGRICAAENKPLMNIIRPARPSSMLLTPSTIWRLPKPCSMPRLTGHVPADWIP